MQIVSDFTALLAITENDGFRWNGHTDIGTTVVVTYSFTEGPDLPPLSETFYNGDSVEAMSAAERANFRLALDEIESRAGIIFVEVPGEAMINAYNLNNMDFAGYANISFANSGFTAAGDLVMDVDSSWAPGTSGYIVLLHELAHAVGLEHPHEGEFVLADNLDNHSQTIMTYNWGRAPHGSTLAPLDIQALRHLYGDSVQDAGWTARWVGSRDRVEVIGSADGETISTPRGENFIRGGNGNDRIIGREAADILNGDSGRDTVEGGRGDDTLSGGGGADSITGGSGNDSILGGAANDRIYGDSGNDVIYGEGGRDLLQGGDGYDTIYGGASNDRLFGGGWSDELHGGDGADVLWGGTSNDTLNGDAGNDKLFGEDGRDLLNGGSGADRLVGGSGTDTLNGDSGNDTLRGGADRDFLSGGAGHDVLRGDDGNDQLQGNDGNDILVGGAGNDSLVGGGGDDTFVFDGGSDRVYDWASGEAIRLDAAELGLSAMDMANIASDFTSYSNGIQIDLGGGNLLFIETQENAATLLMDIEFI